MRRRFWPALLFALLLPLQSFALMGGCRAHEAPSADHCSHHSPQSTGAATVHHCGGCCCIATATSPTVAWQPAALRRTDLPLIRPPSKFSLTLDRLDRPPRLTAA